MRICVFGVGGVGGSFGGRLAASGNSVAFMARGATLEALRNHGLRVESPLGDISLPKVDAMLPEDGESVASLFGDAIDSMATAGGGGAQAWQLVPRWVEEGELPPVDVPQPLLTFTEPIVLDNPEAAQLPAVFLLTVEAGKEVDDFGVFADRARRRGWQVVEMEGSHNPHWFQPEAFVGVFLGTLE